MFLLQQAVSGSDGSRCEIGSRRHFRHRAQINGFERQRQVLRADLQLLRQRRAIDAGAIEAVPAGGNMFDNRTQCIVAIQKHHAQRLVDGVEIQGR